MTDLALALMRHGYRAVSLDRRARGGGPTYVSRLLGQRTVVLGDAGGAQRFYDESLVRRAGAIPPPLGWLLFGRGAVHSLDGEEHRDRKVMFLEALAPARLDLLVPAAHERLTRAVESWRGREVELFDELVRAYGGAVLAWAGLDLSDAEADHRSRQLADIVDGFGFSPGAYARGVAARRSTNRWAAGLVDDVRAGRRHVPDHSPLAEVARTDLDDRTAGVELLNVLRPTVAVAWLGAFAGLALAGMPAWRERLTLDTSVAERYAFAQEVRRTTFFAPALSGLAVREAVHEGVRIGSGDRLLLDIVGINHDPHVWVEPERFRPERFLDHGAGVVVDAFELVPQGGGHPSGHRCPGESLTLRLLSDTLGVLSGLDYRPVSAPRALLNRMPTRPEDGLRLRVPA